MSHNTQPSTSSTNEVNPPPLKKKKMNLPETEETKNMSSSELQRLLLLEQLKLKRLQIEKEKIIMERIENNQLLLL